VRYLAIKKIRFLGLNGYKKMKYYNLCQIVLGAMLLCGCQKVATNTKAKNFNEDVDYLKRYVDVIVLSNTQSAAVAVVPQYQGRVMTSTAGGGESFGWLNYPAIASKAIQPHINVYGGEERFWIGPEGGQFSIFFQKGDTFDLDHWQTPALIDAEPFNLIEKSATQVVFQKKASLTNMSGTKFDLQVERTVRLLADKEVQSILHVDIPAGVRKVAYETDNRLTNTGAEPWTKEKGLLSIWLLGMFKHSPGTTVVIPIIAGPEDRLGPKINDSYFGKVPADRLIVGEDVVFFKADGRYRSKIGASPQRAKPIMGSFDADNLVLTLVQFDKPENATEYVNSMWEYQAYPFAGDVINSYNDGPPAPGKKPLGPFYELESSSPAAALKAGETLRHSQRTIHLTGAKKDLDKISRMVLGVTLEDIESVFQ